MEFDGSRLVETVALDDSVECEVVVGLKPTVLMATTELSPTVVPFQTT